jgi:hypothetical protein
MDAANPPPKTLKNKIIIGDVEKPNPICAKPYPIDGKYINSFLLLYLSDKLPHIGDMVKLAIDMVANITPYIREDIFKLTTNSGVTGWAVLASILIKNMNIIK